MKWYWYIITILIWALAVILQLSYFWWYLLVLMILLNLTEYLLVGIWFGRKAGKNTWLNLIMCLSFGFVWWLPLRNMTKAGDMSEEIQSPAPDDVDSSKDV